MADDDTLDGGTVLPGFQLRVDSLFDPVAPRELGHSVPRGFRIRSLIFGILRLPNAEMGSFGAFGLRPVVREYAIVTTRRGVHPGKWVRLADY